MDRLLGVILRKGFHLPPMPGGTLSWKESKGTMTRGLLEKNVNPAITTSGVLVGVRIS